MVLSVSRPKGAGPEHRQQVRRQVAHEADEQPGEHPLDAGRDAAVQRGAAARAGRRARGATLPQVRQPARPAARAVRMRGAFERLPYRPFVEAGRLVDHEEHEARHRPEGGAEVDARHAADLHQRDHDADQEDLGHRPGPEVGGDAEGALGAARRRAAEAERQERVGERGGADQRDDDDQERRGGRERHHEAAGEGERGVEQRGLAVQARRSRARGRGRRSPPASG